MDTSAAHIIAQAIKAALISPNESDSNGEAANPTDGLYRLARSIDAFGDSLADAIASHAEAVTNAGDALAGAILQGFERLGNGGASTPMGAIEALGVVLERGFENLADSMPIIK